MNPTVILALISDLYNQNAILAERNAELVAELAKASGS
jgi:hypothetical protein